MTMPLRSSALLLAAFVLAAAAPGSWTAEAATIDDAAAATTSRPLPPAVTRRVTFSQLSGQNSVTLRGTDGSSTVTFGVRADELIVGAALQLRYSHSPALILAQSHLKVLLNDEVVGVVPFNGREGGQAGTASIDIDPRFFADFNRLKVQFIGHYSADCEDQLNSALWAEVSGTSELKLTARPLRVASELALLPEPFFDRRDLKRLTLPFIFAAQPDMEALGAAGAVASWFGHLADWRGARFPARFGQLLPGHAVVFATNAARPAFLAGLPAVEQPTLRIIDNPADGISKLLLVLGADSGQLRSAVHALVLGTATLSGPGATVRGMAPSNPRQPYDAPKWVRSDRPTRLGELVDDPKSLQGFGHSPDRLRIPLRVAPDLFTWRSRGIPVNLKFRHNAPPMHDGASRLTLSLNDELIRSFELLAAQPKQAAPPVRVPLLDAGLRAASGGALLPAFTPGGRDQLELAFTFGVPRSSSCRDSFVPNVRGVIDADSTVDFSGFPHYAAMPNLGLFASSGFPFTRYADLAQTVVVLPDRPSPHDPEVMLALMGHMGESTGYPAVGVRVARADDEATLRDADLLVIGTETQQSLLAKWRDHLPAIVAGTRRWLGAPNETGDAASAMVTPQARPMRAAHEKSDIAADGALAALLAFEHPTTPQRSVVVVTASAPEQMAVVLDALDDSGKARAMDGSAVLVHPNKVESFRIGPGYSVGSLPWWTTLHYQVSEHPIVMGLLAIGLAVVMGGGLWQVLRRVAARRLGRAH